MNVGSDCLSVCPCVCLFACLDVTRERKGLGSQKLAGWKNHTINPRTYLEVKRSNIKVTRSDCLTVCPINAHTVNTQYLTNGNAYELQTWYTDGVRRPVSPTSAMTSKVKGQCCKVMWCIYQVLADKSRTKCPRNTKIGTKVAHTTCNNAHQSQGQRSRSPGQLMLRLEVHHIFRTERPTNLKLGTQMKHEDPIADKNSNIKGEGRVVTWFVWEVLANG